MRISSTVGKLFCSGANIFGLGHLASKLSHNVICDFYSGLESNLRLHGVSRTSNLLTIINCGNNERVYAGFHVFVSPDFSSFLFGEGDTCSDEKHIILESEAMNDTKLSQPALAPVDF